MRKQEFCARGGTLITLPQHPEANQALGEVAVELGVRAVSAVPYMPPMDAGTRTPYAVEVLGHLIEIASPLRGSHQHRNVALAIAAAVELASNHGIPITASSIAGGIQQTIWPGRLERLSTGGTEWILDVAHNPAGAWALRAGLRDVLDEAGPRTLIFSCLRDKPVMEMAQILFPLFDRVIFAPIHSPRATPMSDLLAAAEATGTPAEAAESVGQALKSAQSRARRRHCGFRFGVPGGRDAQPSACARAAAGRCPAMSRPPIRCHGSIAGVPT